MIKPAILAVVVVAVVVYGRVRRGRRLLVLGESPSALRWVLNGVFLTVAVLGLVASAKDATGPWDRVSSLSNVALA